MLVSATAAIARAWRSFGRSTGGAASGSKPTKTSGRPVASSQPPRPTAISVGGGRMVVIVRTAVEPPAVSARCGIGPSASRLPASHTMSRAWTTPEARPDRPVGGPEQAVTELAGGHPTEPRPDRFADRDRSDEPDEHDDRSERGVDPRQRIGEVGEGEDGRGAAGDRPDEPRDLRDGARPPAEDGRHDDEQQRERVERVHCPIVAQDPLGRRPAPRQRLCRSVSALRPASRSGAGAPPPRR